MAASMGPPEFTGGNRRDAHERRGRGGGFNGAAGIHRRKPVRKGREAPHRPGCFNGAAGIHRRKRTTDTPDSSAIRMLQWGRRNSPAETSSGWSGRSANASRLQWGRRNSPAETYSPSDFAIAIRSCFNGAAGIHRRKPGSRGGRADRRHVASMGPPEFTGGNATAGTGTARG